jgi:GAF domain-containing protein
VNINDARAHPNFDGTLESEHIQDNLKSLLCVPVNMPSQIPGKCGIIVGVVLLANKQTQGKPGVHSFTVEDQRSLETLCPTIGKYTLTFLVFDVLTTSSFPSQHHLLPLVFN